MSKSPRTLEIEQVIRDVVARGPVLSEENTTLRDIAETYGVSKQFIGFLVKRLGLKWPLLYSPPSAPRSQWPGPGGKSIAWRRANGICTYRPCNEYAVPGMVYCQMHREINLANAQANIKAARAAGLCVWPGCKNKPVTTGYCVEHNDLQSMKSRLRTLAKAKRKHRAERRLTHYEMGNLVAKRQHRTLRSYNPKSTKFGYNSNGSIP